MEPIEVLNLDNHVIGYIIKRRQKILRRVPSSKDVGKPLAILTTLQEEGRFVFDYSTMLTWRPEIFGGYVELRGKGFFEHPVSLLRASKIGKEQKIWTFYRKSKRYKGVTLTEDFTKINGFCNVDLIDGICNVNGWDLLLLASVQTYRQTFRCFRYDTSVYHNSLSKGLDLVTIDPLSSVSFFKYAAKAAEQACFKLRLRKYFERQYEKLVEKYGEIVLPKDVENPYSLERLEFESVENRLFMNLERAVFANEFEIGEKDGISTDQRLESFLTAPQLSADPVHTLEVFEAIKQKDIRGLAMARMGLKESLSKRKSKLDSLIMRTADKVVLLLEGSTFHGDQTKTNHLIDVSLGFMPKYKEEELVVDAANFAFHRGKSSIRRLRAVVENLRRRGFKLTMLMDYSAMSALEKSCAPDDMAFLRKNMNIVPEGRKADEYILDYANAKGLRVVSGDSFKEYACEFPWVCTNRVIKPAISNDSTKIYSYGMPCQPLQPYAGQIFQAEPPPLSLRSPPA